MNRNGWVLLLIVLSALCFGFETAARITSMNTHNAGYLAGLLLFLGAIVVGVRNR